MDFQNSSSQPSSVGTVTVFGGSGFIGKHLIPRLVDAGWSVRVASRAPSQAHPSSSPVSFLKVDIRDNVSVERAIEGADAVVNLVGILSPSPGQSFDAVQHQGASVIARAVASKNGVAFVHVSAIGAGLNSSSAYARTKALGEEGVFSNCANAVVLRPSIVFGPEDDFFNRFAFMSKISPALPLIGGGTTLFEPVYVEDVVSAILAALQGSAKKGTTYELGGPKTYSFASLLAYIGTVSKRRRALVPLPFPLARLVATGIEGAAFVLRGLFPKVLLITRDQVELLRHNNVVSTSAKKEGRTLSALGIKPRSIEEIVPTYLGKTKQASNQIKD